MTLSHLIYNIAQPASCAWLFNNYYHRVHLTDQQDRLVAVGTTRNEALHAELRNAFRQTIRNHLLSIKTLNFVSSKKVRLWGPFVFP